MDRLIISSPPLEGWISAVEHHGASPALWQWIIPLEDRLPFDLLKTTYTINVKADKEKDRLRFRLVHDWLLEQLSLAQDVANQLDPVFGDIWKQVCKGDELSAQKAAAYAEWLQEPLLQVCAIYSQGAFSQFRDVKDGSPWACARARDLPNLAYRAATAAAQIYERLDIKPDLAPFCRRLIFPGLAPDCDRL